MLSMTGNAPAPDIFMGEPLSCTANISSDDAFNAILSTWMQDIQHARKEGELSVCNNEEIAAAARR